MRREILDLKLVKINFLKDGFDLYPEVLQTLTESMPAQKDFFIRNEAHIKYLLATDHICCQRVCYKDETYIMLLTTLIIDLVSSTNSLCVYAYKSFKPILPVEFNKMFEEFKNGAKALKFDRIIFYSVVPAIQNLAKKYNLLTETCTTILL